MATDVAEPAVEAVEAGGFVAVADDDFSRLEASGATWRAVLGRPLWSDGEHLLATHGTLLLVYGFVAR